MVAGLRAFGRYRFARAERTFSSQLLQEATALVGDAHGIVDLTLGRIPRAGIEQAPILQGLLDALSFKGDFATYENLELPSPHPSKEKPRLVRIRFLLRWNGAGISQEKWQLNLLSHLVTLSVQHFAWELIGLAVAKSPTSGQAAYLNVCF